MDTIARSVSAVSRTRWHIWTISMAKSVRSIEVEHLFVLFLWIVRRGCRYHVVSDVAAVSFAVLAVLPCRSAEAWLQHEGGALDGGSGQESTTECVETQMGPADDQEAGCYGRCVMFGDVAWCNPELLRYGCIWAHLLLCL